MLSITDFVTFSILFRRATSNMKMKRVSGKLGLYGKIDMRDDDFGRNFAFANLHSTNGTHFFHI